MKPYDFKSLESGLLSRGLTNCDAMCNYYMQAPHDETPRLRKCRKIAVLQGFQRPTKTDLRHIYDK